MQSEPSKIKKTLYLAIGYLSFVLGFIGMFLPILPTTPFMIVALWAFSKGSVKMHRWLINHSRFGGSLRDWEQYKVIPIKAKLTALAFISISISYLVFFSNVPIYAVILAISSMLGALIYVFTRKSERPLVQDEPAVKK